MESLPPPGGRGNLGAVLRLSDPSSSIAQSRPESSHRAAMPHPASTEDDSRERLAVERVFPLAYDELRRIAHRQLQRESAGHTLETTALVHEAYLRLAGQTRAYCRGRAHFMGIASMAMRRVLVDHARRHRTLRRGGDLHRVTVDMAELPGMGADERAEILVRLDEALDELAALDVRQARVVECRFFGGLTETETAESLGIGLRTVKRDWAKARAWLYSRLHADSGP